MLVGRPIDIDDDHLAAGPQRRPQPPEEGIRLAHLVIHVDQEDAVEAGDRQARIVGLSEEHGVVDLSACTGRLPEVGEVVRIVPNHTCVVSNLFDRMVFHRGGVVTRVEDVAARGTVW